MYIVCPIPKVLLLDSLARIINCRLFHHTSVACFQSGEEKKIIIRFNERPESFNMDYPQNPIEKIQEILDILRDQENKEETVRNELKNLIDHRIDSENIYEGESKYFYHEDYNAILKDKVSEVLRNLKLDLSGLADQCNDLEGLLGLANDLWRKYNELNADLLLLGLESDRGQFDGMEEIEQEVMAQSSSSGSDAFEFAGSDEERSLNGGKGPSGAVEVRSELPFEKVEVDDFADQKLYLKEYILFLLRPFLDIFRIIKELGFFKDLTAVDYPPEVVKHDRETPKPFKHSEVYVLEELREAEASIHVPEELPQEEKELIVLLGGSWAACGDCAKDIVNFSVNPDTKTKVQFSFSHGKDCNSLRHSQGEINGLQNIFEDFKEKFDHTPTRTNLFHGTNMAPFVEWDYDDDLIGDILGFVP